MSLTSLLGHTIEVRRNNVTGTDDYGHPEGTISTVVGTYDARIQHHNSWEDKDGRQVNIQNWRCYTTADADIDEDDQIYWTDEQRLFEVIVVEPVARGDGITHHKYMFLQELF